MGMSFQLIEKPDRIRLVPILLFLGWWIDLMLIFMAMGW